MRRHLAALTILWLAAIAVMASSLVSAHAQAIPDRARLHLPMLVEQQRSIWPDAPIPSYLAGLVEQETCPSLKSPKCWNPKTELRTSRERGVGLGQFTKAFRSDGSVRFDKLTELSGQYKSLHGWSWNNWSDPAYQLTAVVEMNKSIYGRIKNAATGIDRISFTLSAYNGGEGGVLQDRRLCANTSRCDPTRWSGHVERTSLKTRVPHPGYRQSFFAINREYVSNVIGLRRPKYVPFFED